MSYLVHRVFYKKTKSEIVAAAVTRQDESRLDKEWLRSKQTKIVFHNDDGGGGGGLVQNMGLFRFRACRSKARRFRKESCFVDEFNGGFYIYMYMRIRSTRIDIASRSPRRVSYTACSNDVNRLLETILMRLETYRNNTLYPTAYFLSLIDNIDIYFYFLFF